MRWGKDDSWRSELVVGGFQHRSIETCHSIAPSVLVTASSQHTHSISLTMYFQEIISPYL